MIIAGAGMAAALPGVVAAYSDLPVIGVPLRSSKSVGGGLDALLAIAQMPPGVPVACVSVDGSRNAAILAARILAQGGGYPQQPLSRIEVVISRYSRPAMTRIWSDEGRLERWLEVELAALDGWAEVGVVPAEAAREIRAKAQPPSPARVAEIEEKTHHDLAAFVDAVASDLGEEGRWFHYGLTSSDVVDTALALQLQAAGELILEGVGRAFEAVVARAEEHRLTLTIGRTHGVHAEPTTFGLKLAVWAFELDRARGRDRAGARKRAGREAVGRRRELRGDRPGGRAHRLRAARPRARAGRHPGRPARPPRGAARRTRGQRSLAGALRARDPPPRPHRGRRGARAVRQGPEGLLRDAAQAESGRRRADLRPRAGRARSRARRARERRSLARARHLPLLGRARRHSRTRSSRSTTCSTASPGSSRASSSGPSTCARTSSRAAGSSSASGCCSRSSTAGLSRDDAYRLVQGSRDARLGGGAGLPRARACRRGDRPAPRRG